MVKRLITRSKIRINGITEEDRMIIDDHIENLLLRRSRLGEKFVSFVNLNLKRRVVPIIKTVYAFRA